MKRPLSWLALPALLVLCAFGARAAETGLPSFWDSRERLAEPDLSKTPRVRFLTTTDFAPFNFLDPQGRLSGYHVDLARAICAELKVTDRCQIQALPWDELERALDAGEGEAIIAGLAITPDSRRSHLFSRPYLQFPARFVMQRKDAIGEPMAARLKGKRVGVVAGSAHAEMLKAYFPQAVPVPSRDLEAMMAQLKAGAVDAAFGDGMRLAFWLASPEADICCRFAGGPYLAPEYLGAGLAVALRPDDTTLAAAIDAALQQLSGKGRLADLYLRYFPVGFY